MSILDKLSGLDNAITSLDNKRSGISLEYITSPYYRAHNGISVETKKFEFPKQYKIQPVYQWLQEVAYANHVHLNA